MLFRPAYWHLRLALASIPVLFALVPPAHASRALGLSLEALVQQSDATLLGHTMSLRSYWQGPRIVTVTTVAVDELWAGSLAGRNTVDVVTLGGMVGEYGQRVDGAGELPQYGRVVLHISPVSKDEWAPLGMAEGVWHVDGLWGDTSRVRRDVSQGPASTLQRPALWFSAKPVDTVGRLRQAVAAASVAKGSR